MIKFMQIIPIMSPIWRFATKHIGRAFEEIDLGSFGGNESTIIGKFAAVPDLDRRDANTVIIDMLSAGVTTVSC